jgi:hypothetical protein
MNTRQNYVKADGIALARLEPKAAFDWLGSVL